MTFLVHCVDIYFAKTRRLQGDPKQ